MKAYRKDETIFIEIPEDLLIFAAENNPDAPAKITDREKFLNWVVEMFNEVGHCPDSGLSGFEKFLDDVIEEACENDAGIEPLEYEKSI